METLKRLQAWFSSECDGDWEHQRGISIQSTDNPGWWVKIDLLGTRLQGKHFNPVKRGDVPSMDPSPPWLHCFVADNVFNGAGDPETLEEILRIFLTWTQAE